MKLYLVRHAAAKTKADDPARPLSSEGRQEAEAVAQGLATRDGVRPVRLYHSGKRRARETGEILARELGIREVVEDAEALSPDADPSLWDERLENLTEDLMLVGHLPHVERLAGHLVQGDPEAEPVRFDTATVACLEKVDGDVWRLRWVEWRGI